MGTTGTTRVRTLVSKQQPDAGRVPAAGAAGVRCGTRIPGWRSETGVDDSSEASGRVEWTNDSGNYSHGLPNIRHGRYRSGQSFPVPVAAPCCNEDWTGLGEDKRRERMTAEDHGQEPRMEKQQMDGEREKKQLGVPEQAMP